VARLSEADYHRVLAFLYEAGEVDGSEAFPEPVRGSLASLLHADTLWHSTVRDGGSTLSHCTVRDGRVEVCWGWGDGAVAGNLPPKVLEALREYPHEDPIPAAPAFLNRPLRRSDLVSAREWRKRSRWTYVDRPVGAQDWARLWIGSRRGPVAVFEVDSCRGEWDDRVVTVLGLLAPHLGQLLRRAELRAQTAGNASGLTPREIEILGLVAEGYTNAQLARMLWISPNTVRKHLENAFDKLGVHTRAAAVIRAFGKPPRAFSDG
jgi:DNA-binding CsgD family transcriptional regulator